MSWSIGGLFILVNGYFNGDGESPPPNSGSIRLYRLFRGKGNEARCIFFLTMSLEDGTIDPIGLWTHHRVFSRVQTPGPGIAV